MRISSLDLKAVRGLALVANCVLEQMTDAKKIDELKMLIARVHKIHACLLYAVTQDQMSFDAAINQGVPDNHQLVRGAEKICSVLPLSELHN